MISATRRVLDEDYWLGLEEGDGKWGPEVDGTSRRGRRETRDGPSSRTSRHGLPLGERKTGASRLGPCQYKVCHD